MNRFFLGAYWTARQQSVDDCTDRLWQFFSALTACDEALAQWYELGSSRKQALDKRAQVDSREYLRTALQRGRHWTDVNRNVIQDLGFNVWLWNGGDNGKIADVHVACGSYSAYVSNCVTLNFPVNLGNLKDFRGMRGVLSAAAKTWEPDWAGVMSEAAMTRRKFDASRPFVDWMLYISDHWLPNVPAFKPPASVERLPAGTMIIVQQEPPDPDNPTQLENIHQVRNALRGRVKIEA